MIDKSHVIVATVAAALAAGGSSLIVHRAAPPPAVHARSTSTWAELTQAQVDALAAALREMPPRDVAIICQRGCDDLALSFDNAFESAHWNSGIEVPLVDDTVGVSVGPDDTDGRALARAIHDATGGAVSPKMVDARLLEHRIALVIGRKR